MIATALQNALEPVLRALAEDRAAGPCPPLLVAAVSGGMDSMVLAHGLCTLQRTSREQAGHSRFDLLIAHFDHNLRPTSSEDACFVAEAAAAWRLPFVAERWANAGERSSSTGSLEADARHARYAFLAATARRACCVDPESAAPQTSRGVVVLTAHHADDQAETLLLNLLRGSGLAGLAAMRQVAGLPGAPEIPLVRPFLFLPRSELRACAEAAGLSWREDESNSDWSRTRNRLRHELLPLLEDVQPGAAGHLVRTARILADEADRLAQLNDSQLAALTLGTTPGVRICLDAAALGALPPADRRALLRHAVQQTFPDRDAPDYAQTDRWAQATAATPGRSAHGPHPLCHGLAWTHVAARANLPAQLSVHLQEAPPLPPPGPWLDADWRATVGRMPLPLEGTLTGNELRVPGYRLEVEMLPAGAFPGRDALVDASLWEAWLDAAAAPFALTMPAPGDRIAPLGMNGHTRALGDLLTDRKIPPALRAGWPVVVDAAGRIVWLCGLAIAQTAAITATTSQICRLRWVASRPIG